MRDGDAVLLNQRDIVAGDILLLSTGDKVPADGRLIAVSYTHLDVYKRQALRHVCGSDSLVADRNAVHRSHGPQGRGLRIGLQYSTRKKAQP